MLKQQIEWEGFDGLQAHKTLYFNLTRFEISHDMELEVLEQRFQKFQDEVIGQEERKMTAPEIRELLDMIMTIIKHAYGERSSDGKRFTKNEEIWNEFNDTGAFDAFIFYLFDDPNRANAFMEGIWPKEIREAAAKVREERPDIRPVPDVGEYQETPGTNVFAQTAPDDNIPDISSMGAKHVGAEAPIEEKNLGQLSDQDILEMSNLEFDMLLEKNKNGNNVPNRLLVLGFQRNKDGGTTD